MPVYVVSKRGRTTIFPSFEPTNAFTRFSGLMFRKRFTKPLLFTGNGAIAIHSLFCPVFDAVFLDRNRRIVKLLTVKPWTPLVSTKAFFLFECPPGTIAKFTLKKGDKLTWSGK